MAVAKKAPPQITPEQRRAIADRLNNIERQLRLTREMFEAIDGREGRDDRGSE
jgi:hypothetical protein